MEIEDHEHVLRAGQEVEIVPGQTHQAINRSAGFVRFLVTSQPPSRGDRIES